MPERAKSQVTLTGYSAWVFNRLVAAKGDGPGVVGRWIIDRWIEENHELLAKAYDIKREQYTRSQKVVRHPSSR